MRSLLLLAALLAPTAALAQTDASGRDTPPAAEAAPSRAPEKGGLEVDMDGGKLRVSAGTEPADDDPETRVVFDNGSLKVKAGHNDRVAVGDSVVVEAGEEVNDAVAVAGSVTVRGRVLGDAVAVGGRLRLEPGAEVMGDAVAVGGGMVIDPSATVHGNRVNVGGTLGDWIAGAARFGTDHEEMGDTLWSWLTVIGRFVRAALLVLFGLLIVAMAPTRVTRTQEYLRQAPLRSGVAGLALVLAFVPGCILLAVTIVGLPAIPFVAAFYAFLWLTGAAVLATWLGGKILREGKSVFATLALGMALLVVLSFLPLGGLLLFLLVTAPAGAIILSRFGDERYMAPAA